MSRFVIAFLLRGKYLLISRLQSPPTIILDPKQIKSVTVSIISLYKCNCFPWFLLISMFIIIYFQLYPNIIFLRQRLYIVWAFLIAQLIKNFPANAGDARGRGMIPGQEDTLEKTMAIRSSSLAWKFHGDMYYVLICLLIITKWMAFQKMFLCQFLIIALWSDHTF